MNTALLNSSMAPRIHPQWQMVCSLQNAAQNSAHPLKAADTNKTSVISPAPVYALPFLPDVVLASVIEAPERSVQAMLHRARAQEKLICEAETALASQSACTYRKWYAHWRHSGVKVNDLLDMTWVWRQRATI